MPISQRTFTIALVVVVMVFSYQTYALASLTAKIADAKIGLGASSTVNFTSDGSAPNMVGGC